MADDTLSSGAELAANYQYWRDHGHTWADEYAARRRSRPLYHIEEIMIAEYFSAQAPARVLEYGCGPGRHLRHLVRIDGLDVHGYDQSQSMVSGCLEWTTTDWIERHITVGEPVGRLPYDDKSFDVVYTAEVLVHVRPEDLDLVLAELLRISRGHIFHLETSRGHTVRVQAHDGCWKHDLVAAYGALSQRCEILPAGYAAHEPHRVILDGAAPGNPRFVWPELTLELYRRLDAELGEGIRDLETRNRRLEKRLRQIERERCAVDPATRPP